MDQRISSKITELLTRVPGYTGYRTLEDRRDDDRRLRESIANSINGTVQALTSASASLSERRNLTSISTIERLIGSTRLLGDRVRTASYGYGGIFTTQSVDEVALEQLRKFDVAFQNETSMLAELGDRIVHSPDGPLEADITAYQDELSRVALLFDERSAVVDSARPSVDEGVLMLIEPQEERVPSPFSLLAVGDAFSVDGDNFIAETTIEFSSGTDSVKLTKAGVADDGTEVWFVGGSDETRGSARLAPADPASVSDSEGTTGKAVVMVEDRTTSSAPAEYGYTGGTGSSSSFWYVIGGEKRAFTGTSLQNHDIQVYGRA